MADLFAFEHSDGELVVDSRLIAPRLGIKHESFMRTIDNYQTRIESDFGGLRFEIGVPDKPTGNPPRYVVLTEDQATFVMTLSRNSRQVVQCKADLVKAFSRAKETLRRRRITSATQKVYLLDDPVKWLDRGRVFKEDFYREIYRLNGWSYTQGKTKHPVRVAQITVDVVYLRLQPGVWEELTKKNPKIKGRRKYCCHQFLSDNIGNPHLRIHLLTVINMMQRCNSWREFMYDFDKYHPKTTTVQMDILFDLFADCPNEYERWKRLAS